MSLARKQQKVGLIAGEGGEDSLERLAAREQRLQRLRHRRRTAHIHPAHPPVGIEHRQTPAAVRAHRHPVGRKPRLEVAGQRLRCRPGVLAFLHRECGDVHDAALLGQVAGLLEQRLPPIHVGRIEHRGRKLAFIDSATHQLQPPLSVAQVQVHDAGLAGHQSADVGIAGNPEQLVQRGLAGAVVADRQLAHAQNQVDVGDVAPHAAGERRRRHVVAAGIAPGAQPFGDQSSRRSPPARPSTAPCRRFPADRSRW